MTNRTVTLPTIDHGPVTILEPSWCVGHAGHDPQTYRADLLHSGPDVAFTFQGRHITDACLVQSPCADTSSRVPGVSVSVIGRTLDPASLYELAARMDGYADRLRDLADELTAILAGPQTVEQPPAETYAPVGPGCGAPATTCVEGYSPRDGRAHGSLDLTVYACADHATFARTDWLSGLTAYTCASTPVGRRCGERFDFTTLGGGQ